MAAFDFPASPALNQVYSLNGVTYTWNGYAWIGGPLVDTGLFQPKDANLTAIAGLADNAIGVPELDGVGGSQVRPVATIAEFRGGTATPRFLGNKPVWDAAAEVTITYAATWTPDMATFINAVMTLTGALTVANPANLVPGRAGAIRLVAAADQALLFGTNWYFPTGTKPPTALLGESVIYYYTPAAGRVLASFVGPYSNA